MSEPDKVRLDKWLWAARFFKTRALATEAIKGGHVHLNGERVKPARTIGTGDRLMVTKGQERWQLTVQGVSEKRGPAKVAQTLYQESEESIRAREQRAEERRLLAAQTPRTERRPDKKARRQIIRFTRREG